jgi:hypothetical protein
MVDDLIARVVHVDPTGVVVEAILQTCQRQRKREGTDSIDVSSHWTTSINFSHDLVITPGSAEF